MIEENVKKTIQWCPDGNFLNAIPGEVQLLISSGDIIQGYGYGDGISMIFYHPQGDVTVLPEQWVVVDDEGKVTVENARPMDAELFDAQARLKEIQESK